MPKLSERVMGIGRKIGINDDRGIGLAVFLILIIASAAAIAYFAYAAASGNGKSDGYNTMYILDSNNKAVDYQETLIVGQNTTFTVGLYVENHMGGNDNQTYQVQVKVTPNLSSLPVTATPVQTYDFSLKNGDTWHTQSAVTENQVGSYFVVYELYHYAGTDYGYVFTNDYCVLNIQVIN